MNGFLVRMARRGLTGTLKSAALRVRRAFHDIRTRDAPEYKGPNDEELGRIESRIKALGIPVRDFFVDKKAFEDFIDWARFPADYHGGAGGDVYLEKLLEHFVAWEFLGFGEPRYMPYVDVAAGMSPWACMLRSRGYEAFAVDLSVPLEHARLGYYLQEDATRTSFGDETIGSASLQCAYEMFAGTDDMDLLKELGRILKPGGRAVISPLYTHTHACFYQTPEWYGRPLGDEGAVAYVRRDCWAVPSSRKYSPATLESRVYQSAVQCGLVPSVYVLRNKTDVGAGIYLHFILILDKPLKLSKGALVT